MISLDESLKTKSAGTDNRPTLFGQLGQNQLAVIHPSKLENLIEESMDNCKSPVNRVTENIDDFKVGDVVEVKLTAPKVYSGYTFQVTVKAILTLPNCEDDEIAKRIHFDLSEFMIEGDGGSNSWWVERSFWDSEMDFCVSFEDRDGHMDFECFEGTIRKIFTDDTEELRAKLDAANRKIRVLEAGGLADKFSVVGG
jgi:hypothetical protein